MAKVGVITFLPQSDFTENERRAVRAYLKDSVKDELGIYPYATARGQLTLLGYAITCPDPTGYRIKRRGKLYQVFDFEVRHWRPKTMPKEPALKIRRRGPTGVT